MPAIHVWSAVPADGAHIGGGHDFSRIYCRFRAVGACYTEVRNIRPISEAETMYDIEMQTTYMKAMPKRARYYHSLADSYKFKTGQGYKELPDQYVIFICLNDPFGADLPVYTVRNTCLENSAVGIKDGVTSIYLNAGAAAKAKPELREFLAYVGGQAADADDSDLVIALRTAVRSAIDDDEGRIKYMTLLERDQVNIEKGMEKGVERGDAQRLMVAAGGIMNHYHTSLADACV